MADQKQAEVRLAIRQEGQMVNAYVAPATDMAGSFVIGSIAVGLLRMRPALFDQFKALMTDALTALVEVGADGRVLSFTEQPAPEHEKAGHA